MVLEGFKKRLSCRQPYIRELQRYIGHTDQQRNGESSPLSSSILAEKAKLFCHQRFLCDPVIPFCHCFSVCNRRSAR
jgi:hypothetical protein